MRDPIREVIEADPDLPDWARQLLLANLETIRQSYPPKGLRAAIAPSLPAPIDGDGCASDGH